MPSPRWRGKPGRGRRRPTHHHRLAGIRRLADGERQRNFAQERHAEPLGFGLSPAKGEDVDYVAIGNKGVGFLSRLGANIVSQAVQLGDRPRLDRLTGPIKVLLDKYVDGTVDEVHIFFNVFINTMKQEARHGRMLPIPEEFRMPTGEVHKAEAQGGSWDYLYEPDARELLDAVLRRYVEALVYQMVNENAASEQSSRMVAMKAASDNAAEIIEELQLIYNKSRQASITKELSEIVGGAAAV